MIYYPKNIINKTAKNAWNGYATQSPPTKPTQDSTASMLTLNPNFLNINHHNDKPETDTQTTIVVKKDGFQTRVYEVDRISMGAWFSLEKRKI